MPITRTLTIFLAAASLAAPLAAQAHGRDHDGWREHHHGRHGGEIVYVAPRPYVVMPPSTYYYSAPTYAYVAPPRYPAPRYYERSDRRTGQVIGAVAGGVIGNVAGNGRLLPTAVGAVIGGVVGGELAE